MVEPIRPPTPPPQQQPRPNQAPQPGQHPQPQQPQGKTGKDAEEVWDPHQINPSEGSINEPLPDAEATSRAAQAAKDNPPHKVVDRTSEQKKT